MIEPEAFLDFAQNLFDNLNNDHDCIEVRNCISRSYYYIFHLGREKYQDDKRAKFNQFANTYDHTILINFFNDINHKDIADRLSQFRRNRNYSDYRLDYNLKKSDADRWLRTAKTLATRINNISAQI